MFVLAAVAVYFHLTNPRARNSNPGLLASIVAVVSACVLVVLAVLCKETGLVVLAMIAVLDLVCNTPDDEGFTAGAHADSWFWNAVGYVKHIVLRGSWLRVASLLCLQALLLYVRVAILSSG